jgi:hypothetical protein
MSSNELRSTNVQINFKRHAGNANDISSLPFEKRILRLDSLVRQWWQGTVRTDFLKLDLRWGLQFRAAARFVYRMSEPIGWQKVSRNAGDTQD